jgi:hypothetical protein
MKLPHAARPAAAREPGSWWPPEGAPPRRREDAIAEGVALVALVLSLTIGLVIAVLPVSGA